MENHLINSMQNRYAVKKFDAGKKLTDQQLNAVLEAARLTATSYGLQLMKIVVVDNPEIRKELVLHSYNQQQIADASHLLVLCRERKVDASHVEDFIKNVANTREQDIDKLEGYKNMMLRDMASMSEEEQVIWMDKQIYILLGNLMTALAVLNIDSCPMEGFKPAEYDRILGLEEQNLASVLVLPIGYRATDDPNALRKKVRRAEDQFIVRV
ncbi:MAG: NAD(P)H-dependent oxidoreductase [Crocinitomicaceae bacterium]|nr:NAD(P)H-dependent oxidoreductase [Crocinitomicaceae bacterium]